MLAFMKVCSRCTLVSIPPGNTSFPEASITFAPPGIISSFPTCRREHTPMNHTTLLQCIVSPRDYKPGEFCTKQLSLGTESDSRGSENNEGKEGVKKRMDNRARVIRKTERGESTDKGRVGVDDCVEQEDKVIGVNGPTGTPPTNCQRFLCPPRASHLVITLHRLYISTLEVTLDTGLQRKRYEERVIKGASLASVRREECSPGCVREFSQFLQRRNQEGRDGSAKRERYLFSSKRGEAADGLKGLSGL
ncbi:hypothetical protein EYF80_026736 [Liparis tanakae]|uniref:Uncharacterized protein n=1 Tax=Liparis tanakae TaxID=230148 RepID=A0A4Z2HAV4_9TELE|nr:hypothetical protein EYF80_026736 [Liparis tanakae]